jgi:lysophospholipase L1-like esterase
VTVVALGDSLTAGEGDESGQGFAGRLTEAISAKPERANSTLVNLGQSGWDSTMMVNGQDGAPAELGPAVDEVRKATAGGATVLATVLIGSNDLWYVYQNGTSNPASGAEEDAALATYRTNLDRTVSELQQAGAVVVVGLPDDQSRRPGVVEIERLHQYLPDITSEEVGKMSALAKRMAETAQQVAAGHGVLTVSTNDPFWADPAKMAPDGVHPNAAGYADLAAKWMQVVDPIS